GVPHEVVGGRGKVGAGQPRGHPGAGVPARCVAVHPLQLAGLGLAPLLGGHGADATRIAVGNVRFLRPMPSLFLHATAVLFHRHSSPLRPPTPAFVGKHGESCTLRTCSIRAWKSPRNGSCCALSDFTTRNGSGQSCGPAPGSCRPAPPATWRPSRSGSPTACTNCSAPAR